MQKLTGKSAVITGAASGIGLATARLFASEGADVLVVDKAPQASLDDIAGELGGNSQAVSADLTQVDEIDNVRNRAVDLYGKVDVVVASAGIVSFANLNEVDESTFDRVVAINLKGTFFTVQRLLPALSDGASVVLVSSMAARLPSPGVSVYGSTKAAVTHMTRSFAAELKERRIRVNSIAPGNIETPIGRNAGFTAAEHGDYFAQTAKITPLGRNGSADEIATGALYLASEDSSFVTGIELLIDGGFTLNGG